MKRITIWITLAVTLVLLMAFVVVRADVRKGHSWCDRRWRHFGPGSYLAHELRLSNTQREQIQKLWQTEQPTVSAHLHELLAENKEMSALTMRDDSDPGKVDEVAKRQAATIAALLVEKEKLQAKIYLTVLNSEQRAKADELRDKWDSRLDHFARSLEREATEK